MASREYNQAYYQANKAKREQWRAMNWPAIKEKTKIYREAHKEDRKGYLRKPEQRYKTYIRNAQVKGVSFNLSFDDFVRLTESVCYYCCDVGRYGFVGIDRINGQDYHINTCVPCCDICNYMKGSYSESTFITQIQKIYNNRGVRSNVEDS